MKVKEFLAHYGVTENPFGQEMRNPTTCFATIA